MNLHVIRRTAAWANAEELWAAGTRSAKIATEMLPERVRWIRSYVVEEDDGRLGMICIYDANSPDSIREHARLAGIPADDIRPVRKSIIIWPGSDA